MTQSTNVATLKASADLDKSVIGLGKIVESISAVVGTHAETVYQIELADARLAEINAETETAVRESAAELALRIRENKEAVLAELLEDAGLATISQTDLDQLRDQLQDAVKSNADAIESAVSQTKSAAAAAASATKTAAEGALTVATAKLEADVAGLQSQIAFLKDGLAASKEEAKAIRDASVETAKANAPVAAIITGKQ